MVVLVIKMIFHEINSISSKWHMLPCYSSECYKDAPCYLSLERSLGLARLLGLAGYLGLDKTLWSCQISWF